MTHLYVLIMKQDLNHRDRVRRGDRVQIKGGRYDGSAGTVDSVVFQRTEDDPDTFRHGFHIILDCGQVITVRREQVE
jgi:hypothetical protein